MKGKSILLFGSIQSPRALKLKAELEAQGAVVFASNKLSEVKEQHPEGAFSWAVLVVTQIPPPLAAWKDYFASLSVRPRFAAVVEKALPPALVSEWAFEPVLMGQDSFDLLFACMSEDQASAEYQLDSNLVDNQTLVDNLAVSEDFLADIPAGEVPPSLGFASEGLSSVSLAVSIDDEQPLFPHLEDEVSRAADMDQVVASLDLQSDFANEATRVDERLDDEIPADALMEDSPESISDSAEPVVNLDLGQGEDHLISADLISAEPEAVSFESPPSQAAPASEELQTLKRYAMLKEREAKEKEAALQVLQRQMTQVQDKLARSEHERRRLAMQLEDTESHFRAMKDTHEQNKHHMSRLESKHQDELRALQLRLDNAQFQAQRAERKLEEFREKVRADIQKIRIRERELANRLELQKRDAEALITAKDERLLQQKREIDRLEFEIETLKERLLDETQKGEERAARLMRAVQSLRMAEGVLAGIEEEVIPNASNRDDDEGEAA